MSAMTFAIRDDDTSYFTKPNELEKAYDFVKQGTISLSIVPFTVPQHKDNVFPYGPGISYDYYSIEKNVELIDYLNNHKDRYDILLHGYSHEYKLIKGKWVPELCWKDYSNLLNELTEGKELLERLFERRISVFVAPNNKIGIPAIDVVDQLHLNYSGIIQHFDRRLNAQYFSSYFKRWLYRVNTGIAYGGLLYYSGHAEKYAYGIDNYDRLVYEYQKCKSLDTPFVIYTHYWKLLNDAQHKTMLEKLYNFLIDDGAHLISLSDCFNISI